MMRRCDNAAAFNCRVETWISAALNAGATDFAGILAALPGVYPTVALDAIERLGATQHLPTETVERLRHQARHGLKAGSISRSMMPLPHPLEFEWRFTPDGARLLLDLASDLAPHGAPIVLFGTPGVAVEALAAPIQHPLTFIGENNVVTRRVSALSLATGVPLAIRPCASGACAESAAVVVVDPPWYMDFLRPMLIATAVACKMSGFILMSLPPEERLQQNDTLTCGNDLANGFHLVKRCDNVYESGLALEGAWR